MHEALISAAWQVNARGGVPRVVPLHAWYILDSREGCMPSPCESDGCGTSRVGFLTPKLEAPTVPQYRAYLVPPSFLRRALHTSLGVLHPRFLKIVTVLQTPNKPLAQRSTTVSVSGSVSARLRPLHRHRRKTLDILRAIAV
jgi:hypothetical protein